MAKKTYYEKLKDPRWQKKRLEILQRDDFKCSQCGDSENTLNVHHGYYTSNYDPWDYPNNTLHTVCESCHERYEEVKHDVHRTLGKFSIKELVDVLFDLTHRGIDESVKWPFVDPLPERVIDDFKPNNKNTENKIEIKSTVKLPSIRDLKTTLNSTLKNTK